MTDDSTKPIFTEKDTYTKEEVYAILTACESRTRTDFIYHCRRTAEEIEKEIQVEGAGDTESLKEVGDYLGSLRSMQSLAHRAEEDVKALG